jgi:hypothetical protein
VLDTLREHELGLLGQAGDRECPPEMGNEVETTRGSRWKKRCSATEEITGCDVVDRSEGPQSGAGEQLAGTLGERIRPFASRRQ